MTAFSLSVGAVSMLLTVASAFGPAPRPQDVPPAITPEVLEAVVRLDCVFTSAATGNWTGERPLAQTATNADRLDVSLSNINVADGTATLRADRRTASISVRSDRSNLYFLDPGADEMVTLTTVFAQEARPGRLKAVQTRTGRVAMQWYGDCAVDRPAAGGK
jgi:hypothetical protein